MEYLPRAADLELDRLLPLAPAIAIDGPKGVGKTDSAARRATTSYFLDEADDLAILAADLHFSTAADGTILIDEWQRLPETWDRVRRAVDRGATAGRFLLTGSASPRPVVDTHSGAGRILSLRMRPMAMFERGADSATVSLASLLKGESAVVAGSTAIGLQDYVAAISSSGFPGILRAPAEIRSDLIDSYIHRIIDRDLPEFGAQVRKPDTLRRWLAAYAAASSTTTSYAKVLAAASAADATQPSKTTTIAYRDHLAALWILDPVPAWKPVSTATPRLVSAPKHQLADPALALRLMRLTGDSLVRRQGSHMAGPLFESLATLSVRVAAQVARAEVGHLRTRDGDREVDLIVEGPEGQIIGIEVKLTSRISDEDVKHLHWLRKLVPEVADLVVITTGNRAYRRADGVAVVPLALLRP